MVTKKENLYKKDEEKWIFFVAAPLLLVLAKGVCCGRTGSGEKFNKIWGPF